MKLLQYAFVFLLLLSHQFTVAQQEEILFYHADIQIDSTTDITVSETIKVYAAGNLIQRGIFRTLPTSRNINNTTETVRYKIIEVTKNGSPEKYHTKNTSGNFTIYIGDKDVYLSPGEYTYQIQYKASNQIGFFTNYDELYWNVTGNEWDFGIKEASATIFLPNKASVIQQSCYTGAYGSAQQDCIYSNNLKKNTVSWKTENLAAGEGMTVAVGFTKGVIAQPPPPGFFDKYGLGIMLSFIFTFLCGYFFVSWKKYGIDPPKPTVYPQFNIPEDLSPASVGIINKESYRNNFLTASIVSLAVKGYLHIEQVETKSLGIFKNTSFIIKKLKEADNSLPTEERKFFEQLFINKDKVVLDGKYDSKLKTAVSKYKQAINSKHRTLINKGNNSKRLVIPALIIIGVFLLAQCYIWYKLSFDFVIIFFTLFFLIGGIIMFFIVTYLLGRYKWFGWVFGIMSIIVILVFLGFLFISKTTGIKANLHATAGFFIFSFIAICIYQYLIKRPSERKLQTQSLINGFKMYLGTAEEKQLQHFNPPPMTPEVFEKLLPYAMVLGVDKIWGAKFQNILSSSITDNHSYSSTWYTGQSFSPIYMGNKLNASLTNSLTSGSTPPSSSSSGSGSGGGGFSGGGGGGGGGGGW
ncbi:MAG: DUF2207 family protein [Niabella sp.]